VAAISSIFASTVFADDWDDYLTAKDHFYYLDKQNFNSITCTIESKMLSDMLKQTKSLPFKDNLKIVENTSEFSLKFDKSSGLQINRPNIDITIISEKGIADPAKAKQGVAMMKDGFSQQVDGIEMTLEGFFGIYQSHKKESYTIIQETTPDGTPIFIHKKIGGEFTETISSDQVIIKGSNAGLEIESIETYEKTEKNKLIFKQGYTKTTQPMGSTNTEISVAYQKIGSITFPELISIIFTQHLQAMNLEGTSEIRLSNCKLN
jgi:hypothetical protein